MGCVALVPVLIHDKHAGILIHVPAHLCAVVLPLCEQKPVTLLVKRKINSQRFFVRCLCVDDAHFSENCVTRVY